MSLAWEILKALGFLAAAVALVLAIVWRRRSAARFYDEFSDREVCEHLRPALAALKARGHRVRRAGQQREDLPLEIHVSPRFDPQALADELKLTDPVFVSERNVLYCQEDWCEIRPVE